MLSRFFLLFTMLASSLSASACGYYLLGEDYRVALLNPYIIGGDYATFFYSSDRFSHWETEKSGSDRLRNADLWAQELGKGVSGADVNRVLYGTALGDWLKTIDDPTNGPLAKEVAWKAISQRPDILEYMLYAKGYETESGQRTYWGQPNSADEGKSPYRRNFRERAEAGYAAAKMGSFLRERYAYQLFILALYRDDDAAMKAYFDEHFKAADGPLADWARFHMAGAWKNEGRYIIGLANAFRRVPEKAFVAYLRAKGGGGSALNPANHLAAAKTDEERSNLYVLSAVQTPGYALKLIKKAYAYDPANPLIELLLVREINKLEDWLMTSQLTTLDPTVPSNVDAFDWDSDEDYSDYRERRKKIIAGNYVRDRKHLKRLRGFIDDYQPQRADIGKLLRAQTALLDEDYYRAHLFSGSLTDTPGAIGLQARTIQYLAALQDEQLPLAERTKTAARLLPGLSATLNDDNGHTTPALFRVASQQFAAAGDTVTAYLLHNRSLALPSGYWYASEYYFKIDYLDRIISNGVMQRVIDLLEKPSSGNALQQFLLLEEQADVNAVRDLAGTLALRRNDLPTAERHFAAIPKKWYAETYEFSTYLDVSPLSDVVGPKISFPGKLAVVRQLMALEAARSKGGETEAAACYALGQAWYNMSYYGEAWMMLRYGKSADWRETTPQPWPRAEDYLSQEHNVHDYNVIRKSSRALDYLGCSEAASTDPESAARAGMLRANIVVETRRLSPYASYYPLKIDSTRLTNYRKVMDPVVQRYGKTESFQSFSRQCSTLKDVY